MLGAVWPVRAAVAMVLFLALPGAGVPVVARPQGAGETLWVTSASRGMRVVEGGAMLPPFANPTTLRAKLTPLEVLTLRYELGAAATAGCIISTSTDNAKVATSALSLSSTLLSGNSSQLGGAVARGNRATHGVATYSVVIPANEPASLLIDIGCRSVGETVVRTSLSLLERGRPATRDVLINEFIRCTAAAPPPAEALPPLGFAPGGQGAMFGSGAQAGVGVGAPGGCPLGCSGHGTCEEGRCTCAFGWFGPGCEDECPGGTDAPCSLRGECHPVLGLCKVPLCHPHLKP